MAQHKHTTMHAYYMNIRVYVEQETRKKPKEEAENQIQVGKQSVYVEQETRKKPKEEAENQIQVGKQRNKQLEISEARR